MSEREHLLGYLLGALESHEQDQVERALECRPELRGPLDELRKRVDLLSCDRDHHQPPQGLARRTCAWLAEQVEVCPPEQPPVAASHRGGLSTAPREWRPVPRRQSWSLADLIVSGGIALVAAFLFFPAIAHSRFRSQVVACQNNLRQIGDALFLFASDHQGRFPELDAQGCRAYAGIFGSLLREGHYLGQPRVMLCPAMLSVRDETDFEIPLVQQVEQAEGEQRRGLQDRASGHYAYYMGYFEGPRLVGPRNYSRANFPLVSDAPLWSSQGLQSKNHDGFGQNVLFEGGNLAFLPGCVVPGTSDHIFLNDRGVVGAGQHAKDVVLAAGSAAP